MFDPHLTHRLDAMASSHSSAWPDRLCPTPLPRSPKRDRSWPSWCDVRQKTTPAATTSGYHYSYPGLGLCYSGAGIRATGCQAAASSVRVTSTCCHRCPPARIERRRRSSYCYSTAYYLSLFDKIIMLIFRHSNYYYDSKQ